jgi:stage V sporulation protein K
MANAGSWLKAQLGPSPLVTLSMLVLTVCGVLTAFRMTPSVPTWLGLLLLGAVVATATSIASCRRRGSGRRR